MGYQADEILIRSNQIEILDVIESGKATSPVKIFKSTTSTWKSVYNHLYSFEERGLVKSIKKGSLKNYSLTEKGRKVLKALKAAQALLEGK